MSWLGTASSWSWGMYECRDSGDIGSSDGEGVLGNLYVSPSEGQDNPGRLQDDSQVRWWRWGGGTAPSSTAGMRKQKV